jgi:hypothetical protein
LNKYKIQQFSFLDLNADESVILRIGDDNPQKQYYIGDTELKSVTSRNDLENNFKLSIGRVKPK